ncbi:nicotinate (nicotinamide) nucleotide adenylyltransferase [Aliikangiella sp. G2MR2-5]|uniref:nicotinate (nicotinamide) nucleotide adenylyltransferase n=1 Tax=Aliikangiella sp. G2MR2-5 TaxID=2788943 RepID=UPI0018A9099A|nr:nicotinate (nicotinamide) nucleotide adenylyltransferase [Aliikangiella sp. G2MR2-5]
MSPSSKQKAETKRTGLTEFVFGGTFDPVHRGHLAIIKALKSLKSEYPVRIIPCSTPALKSAAGATFADRVAMLRLALTDCGNWLIDERESERPGPSYSVDTLAELQLEEPKVSRIFVMGADSAKSLCQWHQWHKLASLCHLIVVNRPEFSSEEAESSVAKAGFDVVDKFSQLERTRRGAAFIVKMQDFPESSTKIRCSIANGKPLDSMLTQSVIEYIRQKHLYE